MANFKTMKGETMVSILEEHGKAVLYFHFGDRYIREVKTDIDADFDGKVFVVLASTWKAIAERIDFIHASEMFVSTVDRQLMLHLDDTKASNSFETSVYHDFDLEMFDTSECSSKIGVDFLKKIKASRPFVSKDDTRYFMQVFHFSDDGVCVATDGRIMSVIKGDRDFGKWLCDRTTKKDDRERGNIFAEVFDCFDGKHDITVSVSHNGVWLKLTDGKVTVYTKADAEVSYPNWTRVIPDTKGYAEKTMTNMSKFTDKKLLKSLKQYHYRVCITNGVAHTVDDVLLFEVGEVLNDYTMNAEYLSAIAGLFGDSVTCPFNPENNQKCVVYGDLYGDFALVMPMQKY